MSYVKEIRCDSCGRTTEDEHVQIVEHVKVTHRKWLRVANRYETTIMHLCESCWGEFKNLVEHKTS